MAKSKSGGTRAMIRGRVGADVYSIGRDSAGKKQQVVRSLAESVSNPQTLAQMRGRMIMYSVMQALTALRPIVDHAFDGYTGKQANLSEFIRQNYALVKADVAAHPKDGNKFGLNSYKESGAKQGCYVVADGKAELPAAISLDNETGKVVLVLGADNLSIAGLKKALGLSSDEYFTLVGLSESGMAKYERFRVNPGLAEDTNITADNVNTIFAVEGNSSANIALVDSNVEITLSEIANCCAVIISRKQNGQFVHNKAVLSNGANFNNPADIALPTYPVGSQDYLNGGDIFGATESVPEAGTPSAPVISGTTPFETSTSVTITAATGAQIRYTTNGSNPTASTGSVYNNAISLTESATIKAIAVLDGKVSPVAEKAFVKEEGPIGGDDIPTGG